jgi:hypothetical protein
MAGSPVLPRLVKNRKQAEADGDPGTQHTDGAVGVMHGARVIAVVTSVVSGLATVAFALLPQLHLEYTGPRCGWRLRRQGHLSR